MGSSYRYTGREPTRAEKAAAREAALQEAEAARSQAQAHADAILAKRMALADKIVLAVVDRISSDIIRPGPKPEERECYVMAQELREHTEHLSALVSAILKIEADEAPTTPGSAER